MSNINVTINEKYTAYLEVRLCQIVILKRTCLIGRTFKPIIYSSQHLHVLACASLKMLLPFTGEAVLCALSSGSSNNGVKVPAMRRSIKADITPHEESLRCRRHLYLGRAIIQYLPEDFAPFGVVQERCWTHFNSGRMIWNITILRDH
ncbi:conserved hypothetical protein [Ricinus communis]|uniref:Uncharacterized protein n=1 Tax=Ricinus communis TaxID=3988 RepID=B9RYM4_RICCO|nr:conserved hypothetical protein [Ricinus communis]